MTDSRRVIMVVGMPSGGTSLIAGLLHHLGVDMGRVTHGIQPGPRQYEGFECLDCWEGGIEGAYDASAVETFVRSVVTYLHRRLAGATGPIGVKHNPLAWLGMVGGVEALPIRTVAVHRPLDDVMRSDRKYVGDDLGRAARMGMHWLAMQRLLEQAPPVVHLDFEASRRAPARTIDALVTSLGLVPTPAQMAQARSFVRPLDGTVSETLTSAQITEPKTGVEAVC